MKAFWLAVITACIWGFAPFLEKIGLSSKNMDPLLGVVFRATGGVCCSHDIACFPS